SARSLADQGLRRGGRRLSDPPASRPRSAEGSSGGTGRTVMADGRIRWRPPDQRRVGRTCPARRGSASSQPRRLTRRAREKYSRGPTVVERATVGPLYFSAIIFSALVAATEGI